ncbi:MAG: glycosyltransferase [Bacteroidales bacterium]|jgi:glycosyltransferase involved in cell wall biosynthesis|nr:glycosyltransferase [Bacteroidales bacterium]
MKALFLIFHGFESYNKGISKKIMSQVKALNYNGIETQLSYLKITENDHHIRMIGDKILEDYGTGIKGKIRKRIRYKSLIEYILSNKIKLVYIRSAHNANPCLTRMLKKLHKHGIKLLMEIPTYPYDQEYNHSSLRSRIHLQIDRYFRKHMAKYLYRMVTFSDAGIIFGVSAIHISNGIDFDEIPVKKIVNENLDQLNLIGVAEIHFWHGFDRIIKGLSDFYKKTPSEQVVFHIVGSGDMVPLRSMVKDLQLEKYVVFHGTRFGKELDDLFEISDMGIASLARHRSGITRIKTLKNREYAARGIPFVYSEIDEDFENMPYVMKIPADDTPVNIPSLIDFYHSVKMNPQEIRNSIIDELSWNKQMKIVIDQIKDINENT